MEVYQGTAVFGGIVAGKIHVYRGEQIHRFRKGVEIALEQLKNTYHYAQEQGKHLDTYYTEQIEMNLTDGEWQDELTMKIERANLSAEYAIVLESEERISMIKDDDFYEKEEKEEQIAICRETADRLVDALKEINNPKNEWEEPTILVADNLTFLDTAGMKLDQVAAFVTANGMCQEDFTSRMSHLSLLARTMSIPTVVNVENLVQEELIDVLMCGEVDPETVPVNIRDFDGRYAIVDGTTGTFYVDPDEETIGKFLG